MRRHYRKPMVALMTLGLLLTAAGVCADAAGVPNPPAIGTGKLIVHEWGTFLTVQGSDGATLGGMVASEEVLPPFVESRSIRTWERSLSYSKMETPVTYFYTDQPQVVQVRVDMPKGLLTHWYPMVSAFGPDPKTTPAAAGSYLNWAKVQLIPHTPTHAIAAGAQVPTLWRVKSDDTWRFARQTDAALVKVHSRNLNDASEFDFEKFLFYRGLGTVAMPLEVRSTDSRLGIHMTLRNQHTQPLQGIFAIRVANDTIAFAALPDLAGKASHKVTDAAIFPSPEALDEGVPAAKQAVAAALIRAGLYEKEAQAMVNSWEKGYFRTEGLRLLYVLPRDLVDTLIPIQIKPAPEKLVRVMVGRTEVLTPETEHQIEKWIAELGAREFAVRDAASSALARLGRLGEPALRRVAAITTDAEVRSRANRLIQRATTAGQ